jgi:hypothetical protein
MIGANVTLTNFVNFSNGMSFYGVMLQVTIFATLVSVQE